MPVSWSSFLLGLIIGIIIGAFVGILGTKILNKSALSGADALAWLLVTIWISWHVAGGLSIVGSPPTVFDIVSGASVGYILGEKFFEFLKILK